MPYIPTGALLIFAAAVLWGIDGVLRRSLFGLPPISIVFLEHLIGAFLFAPFVVRAWKSEMLTRREWGALSVVALFSGVLGTLFFTTALLKIGFIAFSVVFLIQKLQPVFAVLSAAIFLKERITKEYFLWAALALVAGYFVTFPYGMVNTGDGGAYVTAALFALLAAICWGASTALSRYALLNHSHTFITGLRFLLTVPIAFLGVLLLDAAPSLGTVTAPQIGTLCLIAISTGAVALWIYYRGLRSTPASVATIVELAFPLTAIFIDYFLYGTILAWTQYAAAAFLLYTMYRVSLSHVERSAS